MAKKKTKRRSYKKSPVAKYAKSHGYVLPHGYEVRHVVVKKKKRTKKRK